ncbi:MAG: DUF1707 SHOCT-like domain-containing protein [Nocardioides sp.]
MEGIGQGSSGQSGPGQGSWPDVGSLRPAGPPSPDNPAHLRISDADRNRVAEVLRRAAGDGRIDFEELDERLEATFAAKTYADLVPLTADLPDHAGQPEHYVAGSPTGSLPRRRAVGSPVGAHSNSWVVMGERRLRGAWLVPQTHTAIALMGSVVLDLREATFECGEITIKATAVMGEVQILVDAHTRVVVDGVPIMGEFSQARDKVPARLDEHSPTVRIRGVSVMGSVSVVRQPPPGTPRKFFGTY